MSSPPQLKVFIDSDVIISGSFSQKGASFLILQIAELGFIQGYISPQVLEECRRNIHKKLPSALASFNKIVKKSYLTISDPSNRDVQNAMPFAEKKDAPILAGAIKAKADYLTMFNTKDYYPTPSHKISIVKPQELLKIVSIK